jgi:hypothetical protein
MIFIDFETDGLNGPVTEVAVVRDGSIIADGTSIDVLAPFATGDGTEMFVFWHYFMPSYLERHHMQIFTAMRGNFICFTDVASYLMGALDRRIKIAAITQEMLGREHAGNARQDAIDLYQCYMKGKRVLSYEARLQ